jgi:hypothetical protein
MENMKDRTSWHELRILRGLKTSVDWVEMINSSGHDEGNEKMGGLTVISC